jgi:beta-lactamase superfamily II metal-dependent hydrolase
MALVDVALTEDENATALNSAAPALRIDVVDVGHGSCVVVRVGEFVAIIDTGPNGALLEYLRQEGIDSVDVVIISHADADHIAGLSGLLSQQVVVRRVIWNSDSMKTSDLWEDLVFQLDGLHEDGATKADEEAADGLLVELGDGAVAIKVIAPRIRLRRRGAGGKDELGQSITSNSVSVVVQVIVDGESVLLVPGDIDGVGLYHLLDRNPLDISSRYLVLPHHGGRMPPVSSSGESVYRLVQAVNPEAVFVSNGRGRYGTPRPDVIEAVRKALPAVQIACTQLSASCSAELMPRGGAPVSHSAGWLRGASCAGTIRLAPGDGIGAGLDRRAHIDFVSNRVSAALCRRAVPELPLAGREDQAEI